MVLTELLPEHKQSLANYILPFSGCRLSAYAAENIYIWSSLYRISWGMVEDCLCVFFEDKNGCFLYLPPLGRGERERKSAAEICFGYMREKNGDASGLSRIENVPQETLPLFRDACTVRPSMQEYLCSRERMAELRGGVFKSKRSSCNHFAGNYRFEYRDFSPGFHDEIEALYGRWAGQRRGKGDRIYCGMIDDSRRTLSKALRASAFLEYRGGMLFVEGQMKGFTLGYALDSDTFCVLFEFTDLSCKGAAQFIFREFCRRLEGYSFVNVMDDSGLENLGRVKMSYRPPEVLQVYSVFPQDP